MTTSQPIDKGKYSDCPECGKYAFLWCSDCTDRIAYEKHPKLTAKIAELEAELANEKEGRDLASKAYDKCSSREVLLLLQKQNLTAQCEGFAAAMEKIEAFPEMKNFVLETARQALDTFKKWKAGKK